MSQGMGAASGVTSSAMNAVGGLTGVIGGFTKKAEGKRMARLAQQKIDDFEWDELTNPYANMQVSTAGADIQKEEVARNAATATQAMRGAGARGVANIGKVQAQANQVNREIAADVDRQVKDINRMKAQDEVNLRGMRETRQANELAGYGKMLDVGRSMKYQGIGDIASGFSAMGEGMGGVATGIEELNS